MRLISHGAPRLKKMIIISRTLEIQSWTLNAVQVSRFLLNHARCKYRPARYSRGIKDDRLWQFGVPCFDIADLEYFRKARQRKRDRTNSISIINVVSTISPTRSRRDCQADHFNYAIDVPDTSAFSSFSLLLTACSQTILVRLPLMFGKKVATSTKTLLADMAASETSKRRV